jgi:protein-disulfide isomerase
VLRTKHFIFLFLPAIFVVMFGLLVGVIRYQPLYPKTAPVEVSDSAAGLPMPIFPDDPIIGDKKSPLTLVAFEDFGCESCREQMEVFRALQAEYPKKIKVVWKGLPVTKIPYPSNDAHIYAYCAGLQGAFVPFEEAIFSAITDLSPGRMETIKTTLDLDSKKFSACLAEKTAETWMERNQEVARAFNIQAVPTIFMNNQQIQSPRTLDGWKTLLQL